MDRSDDTAADARAVANCMLAHSDHRLELTNLAVQKLVFFAHGICLAAVHQPLIRNGFEAWEHGPVVPALYDALKSSGARPIRHKTVWHDWELDRFVEVPADLNRDHHVIIDVVLEVYGHLNGLALSDLTHEVGTPWYSVRYPPRGALYLNNRIPDELIARYFATTSKDIHRRAREKVSKSLI
jgi:uncharacterized phage-associated protein